MFDDIVKGLSTNGVPGYIKVDDVEVRMVYTTNTIIFEATTAENDGAQTRLNEFKAKLYRNWAPEGYGTSKCRPTRTVDGRIGDLYSCWSSTGD